MVTMQTPNAATPSITIVRGDITEQSVDAIVNAANTSMQPGGGVDGAITRAAGDEALADRLRVAAARGKPPLPTGEAVATDGGELPCRWIIHTAGPVYSGRDQDALLLTRCHVNALSVADQLGATSVAFPAISCGVYGYPPDRAASVAIVAVMHADTAVRQIRFVLFDAATEQIFRDALDAATS
jgi:O-acetyl-ADP-ribose deacetylase (regulator of RNase III)